MFREIKWFFQKLFKGYNECDLWGLDCHLCELIIPRLKAFKKINQMSYPSTFKGPKDWHKAIDKMIWALENWDEDGYCFTHYGEMKFGESTNGGVTVPLLDTGCKMNKKLYEKHWQKVNEGMDLFRKHFFDLWD